MAKNTDSSIKLLVLYDILLKSTDEEHALSTNEIIRNFPLFCPKCKLTHIVDVEKLEIIIKNSEKQTF